MIGDVLAWIFGALSVLLLIAGRHRRERLRQVYHQVLIREFSEDGEVPAGPETAADRAASALSAGRQGGQSGEDQ